jgi:septal ring factor EnvC (AmiA/AmiB activator)
MTVIAFTRPTIRRDHAMLYAGILALAIVSALAQADYEKFGSWGWAAGMAIAAIVVAVGASKRGARKIVARTSRRTKKNHEDIGKMWKDIADVRRELLVANAELLRALRERDTLQAAYQAIKKENDILRSDIAEYKDRITSLEQMVEGMKKKMGGEDAGNVGI